MKRKFSDLPNWGKVLICPLILPVLVVVGIRWILVYLGHITCEAMDEVLK
jgi:hypothetical protein